MSPRSSPTRIATLILGAHLSMSESMSAPFAKPPAIHTTERWDINEAAVACGLVAFESSTQVIPSAS